MTKKVDFTKKIVCSDESVKVIHVLPVNYVNDNLKYLIVYETKDGYQNNCSVNVYGNPNNNSSARRGNLKFSNPEPEVVYSTYRNVYAGGISDSLSSRKIAHDFGFNRVAVLEFLTYDDNSQKVNYIEV